MSRRLFVAIDVPASVRDALATGVASLRERYPQLRWVPPADWHVTLAFLGATTTAQRLRAQIALQAVARTAAPCDVELDGGLGRFADRVLWAGIADARPLQSLAATTRDALAGAGVPFDDRPFRAHVTVARARRGRPVPRAAAREPATRAPTNWTVRRIAVMASWSGGSARGYRRVASWPLTPLAGPRARTGGDASVTAEHPFV